MTPAKDHCVKSFAGYQRSKGKGWKEKVTKKNRGSKGKRDEKSGSSEEKEVVIFNGLVE